MQFLTIFDISPTFTVEIGATLLKKLATEVIEVATSDPPKREGNRLSLFLKPREKK